MQRRAARRIEEQLRGLLIHPIVTFAEMGRVAPKVESFEEAAQLLKSREEKLRTEGRLGYGRAAAKAWKQELEDPCQAEFFSYGVVPGGGDCPARPIVADRP